MYERIWTYDLETVENDRAHDYYAQKSYPAPGNYKDPEKIEKAIAAKRASDRAKAPLHWWTAQIVCISVVEEGGKAHCFYGADETNLLREFFMRLTRSSEECASPITLIGKESKNFDFGMVVGRSLANSIEPHRLFKRERTLTDINDIFGFSSACGQIGRLSDYAWGMDYPGKLAHGSQVADMYNRACLGDEKAWEEIKEYCIQDSMIVHEMAKRYHGTLEITPSKNVVSETIKNIPF